MQKSNIHPTLPAPPPFPVTPAQRPWRHVQAGGKGFVGVARDVESQLHSLVEQTERRFALLNNGRGALHPLHESIGPDRWGVTKADLHAFQEEVYELWRQGGIVSEKPEVGEDDPHIGPSIYTVNEQLIKPKTLAAGGMSWALMCHPEEGLACDIFVTHCWAEGAFEFCNKVIQMWPGPLPHGLYACFLANPQNGDITALLGEDPYQSPFAKALQNSRHFLVVPNSRKSIYTRLWCVFEIHLATQYDLQISLPSHPRKTKTFLALLPAWGICLLGFLPSVFLAILLFFWLNVDRTGLQEDIWRYLMWMTIPIASLILCPCMLVAKVWVAYMLVFLLGAFIGFRVVWWVNHPYELLLPGALVPQTALVMRGFGYVIKAIVKQNLDRESALLDVDTVRHATCTSKSDEKKIRSAISGLEDEIDDAIAIVRAVGKYSSDVVFNLDRGMGYLRASLGIWPLAVVAGTCFWVLSIGYIGVGCGFCDDAHNTITVLVIWIVMLSLATFIPLVCWFVIGEKVIFASDVLLWSGVVEYVVHFTLAFIGELAQQQWIFTWLILFFMCFNIITSVMCCLYFYCGVYARAKHHVREAWKMLPEADACLPDHSRDSNDPSREQDPRAKSQASNSTLSHDESIEEGDEEEEEDFPEK